MVFDILGFYEEIYQDLLAVPVIKGIKSELERFAGGIFNNIYNNICNNICNNI